MGMWIIRGGEISTSPARVGEAGVGGAGTAAVALGQPAVAARGPAGLTASVAADLGAAFAIDTDWHESRPQPRLSGPRSDDADQPANRGGGSAGGPAADLALDRQAGTTP